MRAGKTALILSYMLGGMGALATALSPVPRGYAAMIAAAGLLGAFWDMRAGHFMPRIILNAVGIAGFTASLLPFNRETLAEQALSALAFLMAIKLLEPKEKRDHLQILALSLIIVSGGASLAPELVFGLLFLADLFLGIFMLVWLPFADKLEPGMLKRGLLGRLGGISVIMGLAALPLAAVIFIVLPRAINPFWMGFARTPTAISGFSDRLLLGQVGRISLSRAVAFRAEMERPQGPLSTIPYWRGIVLEVTDGKQWTVNPSPRSFTGRGGTPTVQITYYIEPHGEREIFLLEQPVAVTAGFRSLPLQNDRVARLRSPLFKAVRYQGYSRPDGFRPGDISEPEKIINTILPQDFPPRIRDLAGRLAEGESDPQRVAGRLLDYLGDGYTYSLEVPVSGGNPLEEFLLGHKRGYCEYFASALAVMLRARGIPARLVAGYLGGEYNETGNYYLVRQAAAHTWVEAYLGEQGWVRLDPTPAAGELGTTLATRSTRRPLLWLDALRMKWNSWVVQYDTEAQVGLIRETGRDLRTVIKTALSKAFIKWSGLIILVIILAVKLAGGLRGRLTDPVRKRYMRLIRLMSRRGLGYRAYEGPVDYCGRIAKAWPDVGGQVAEFTGLYVRARYRGDVLSSDDLENMDRLLKIISKKHPPG